MKQNMEQLVKCLNTQKFLYRELLKLSEEKKQAIVKNKIDVLNEVVAKEKDLIAQLNAIEEFRIKCSEQVNKDLGLSSDSPLSEVIQKAEGTAGMLEGLLKELTGVIDKLKSTNKVNNELINMQLDYIDVIKSSFFSNGTNNYGNDGKTALEQQQSVNLFDRMV